MGKSSTSTRTEREPPGGMPPEAMPFGGPGTQANDGETVDYGISGLILYAYVRARSTGQWFNATAAAMEVYQDGHWVNYPVLLTEIGTSGIYLFRMPGTVPADDYDIGVRQKVGGAYALNDPPIALLSDHWTGAVLGPIVAPGAVLDPWATALPGAYAAGSAGNILGSRLDTTVGSRLATAGYTVPPTVTQIDAQLTGAHGAGSWGAPDPWAVALPGAYAAGSAGNILGNRLDQTISSRPTAAQIDTQLTGSHGNGSWAPGDPWGTVLPGAYAAGTAGNIVGNRLDVAVGSRPTAAQIDTQLSGTHGAGSWTTPAAVDPWATPLPGSYAAGSAGNILGNRLDQTVGSRLAAAAYTAPPTVTQIDTQLTASHGAGSWVAATAPDPWLATLPGAYGPGTAGNIVGNRLDVAVGSRPTAAAIDTQLSGTHGAGSWVAPAAVDPWATPLPGAYAAGSAGNILGNRLDANITSRPSAAQIDTQLSGTHGAGSWSTANLTDPWATPLPGSYTPGTAGNILGNRLDVAVGSRLATAGYTAPPTPAQIDTQLSSTHGAGSWLAPAAPVDPWSVQLPGSYVAGSAGNLLGNRLDVAVGSRPTAAQVDTQLSGTHGAGAWGAASAPDPWATLLPGAYAAGTAGDIIGNRVDAAITSRPTTAQIDTQLSGTHGGGSWVMVAAADPWLTPLPGAYAAGSAGEILGNRLDVAVGSLPTAAVIDAQLSASHGDGAWTTGVPADPWAAPIPASYAPGTAGAILGSRLDAAITSRPTAAEIDTQLSGAHGTGSWGEAAIDDPWATPLPGSYPAGSAGNILGNNLDAQVSSRLAAAGYVVPPTPTQIDQRLSTVHGAGSWEGVPTNGGSGGNGFIISYPSLVPTYLTQPGVITRRRGDRWQIQLTGLGNLQNRTGLAFGMKVSSTEEDPLAALMISEAGGLLTLAGEAAADPTLASLTVDDDVTGAVTLVVAALATKELHADFDYPYDMQLTLPGTPPDVRTIAEGIFSIVPDIVRVPS